MSNLRQRVYVACPSAQAKSHLANFFDSHRGRGGLVRLTLHVPLIPGAGDDLTVSRDAVGTMEPLQKDGDDALHRMSIRWNPAGGPIPTFEGDLVAEHDELYDGFVLRISGTYASPFGAAFGAVLGNRIAEATAHRLLRDIARSVEDDYLACEERKLKGREDVALKTLASHRAARGADDAHAYTWTQRRPSFHPAGV